MVGGSAQLVTGLQQPNHNLSQRGPVGKPQPEVVKPGGVGWRRLRLAVPGVQRHMVVIGACREECRLFITLRDMEAKDVAVEDHRPLKIGHGQIHVPDVCAGTDLPSPQRNCGHVGRRRQTAGRMTAQRIVCAGRVLRNAHGRPTIRRRQRR